MRFQRQLYDILLLHHHPNFPEAGNAKACGLYKKLVVLLTSFEFFLFILIQGE
jgi:hypothetical protein